MTDLELLLDRNAVFAEAGAHRDATIVAREDVFVIACLDPRTDPSAFLGLVVGDAMVVRNAGGRVTSEVVKDLALVCQLSAERLGRVPAFEVMVVHHDQCGTRFLADHDFRSDFAALIGGDEESLATEAVTDPEHTVRHDVDLLLSQPSLPGTISVSGHVYAVGTGLLTTIVPTTPMPAGR